MIERSIAVSFQDVLLDAFIVFYLLASDCKKKFYIVFLPNARHEAGLFRLETDFSV